MAREMSILVHSGICYQIRWECCACGAQGEIQSSDDLGEVRETINHTCSEES